MPHHDRCARHRARAMTTSMPRPITRDLPPLSLGGSDRRSTTRVLIDLEVDCEGEGVYLFAISRDLSVTGIFVRTLEQFPRGTRLNLRLCAGVPDDLEPPRQLTIEGE